GDPRRGRNGRIVPQSGRAVAERARRRGTGAGCWGANGRGSPGAGDAPVRCAALVVATRGVGGTGASRYRRGARPRNGRGGAGRAGGRGTGASRRRRGARSRNGRGVAERARGAGVPTGGGAPGPAMRPFGVPR